MKTTTFSLVLLLFVSACSHKTDNTVTESTVTDSTRQFSIAAGDVTTVSVQDATSTPNLIAPHTKAVVDIQLSRKAAADFRKFTEAQMQHKVQILIGSKVVVQPVVESVIASGRLQLPFSTREEAQAVADALGKK